MSKLFFINEVKLLVRKVEFMYLIFENVLKEVNASFSMRI